MLATIPVEGENTPRTAGTCGSSVRMSRGSSHVKSLT